MSNSSKDVPQPPVVEVENPQPVMYAYELVRRGRHRMREEMSGADVSDLLEALARVPGSHLTRDQIYLIVAVLGGFSAAPDDPWESAGLSKSGGQQ